MLRLGNLMRLSFWLNLIHKKTFSSALLPMIEIHLSGPQCPTLDMYKLNPYVQHNMPN